jgi:hypothetical protein
MLGGTAPLGGVDEVEAAALVKRARVVSDVAERGVEVLRQPVGAGDALGQDFEYLYAQGVCQCSD